MFKGIDGLRLRAEGLTSEYYHYKEGSLVGQLDTRNAPPTHLMLRNIAQTVGSYAMKAREIMADPAFANLHPDAQHNITALAEECELGVKEIGDHSHPDSVWAEADHGRKHDVTQHLPAHIPTVHRILARLRGQLREQQS